MESLFTDLEHDRRIEVSRLNGGLLLGHILEYLKNPYIHPETGHKVLSSYAYVRMILETIRRLSVRGTQSPSVLVDFGNTLSLTSDLYTVSVIQNVF